MSKSISDVIIAIPSHRRADLLAANTLRVLEEGGMAGNRVDVYVSDEADAEAYRGIASKKTRLVLQDTGQGLTGKLQQIHRAYPKGTPVLVMEDDIRNLCAKDGSKTRKANAELSGVVASGFAGAASNKTPLWGVGASCNGFYMNDNDSTTLKLIVGYGFGFFSQPELSSLMVTVPLKHDYERTCRYYDRYKKVFRINSYAWDTVPYKTPGGLQNEKDTRADREEASVRELVRKFPTMLARNTGRASMYPELKFLRQKSA